MNQPYRSTSCCTAASAKSDFLANSHQTTGTKFQLKLAQVDRDEGLTGLCIGLTSVKFYLFIYATCAMKNFVARFLHISLTLLHASLFYVSVLAVLVNISKSPSEQILQFGKLQRPFELVSVFLMFPLVFFLVRVSSVLGEGIWLNCYGVRPSFEEQCNSMML